MRRHMKKNRKRAAACLLAAALASSAVTGCQRAEASSGENQKIQESPGKENAAEGKDIQESMENLNAVKGKAWKAPEPEKVILSPEDHEGWDQLLAENEISETFAKSLDEFAYESGSAVLKEGRGNGNYSPLSLYYTLALAACGARGDTAAQILEQLGAEDPGELADQCRKLYQWYAYYSQREQERMAYYGMEDYRSAIQLGNSLWISDQLPVYETYQKLAGENFFASSFGVDFGNTDTGRQMGAWIAEKTHGMLNPQIYVDPATLLAIINTLYFYGGWTEPFSGEMTREDVFHLEEGGQVTVPYLNRAQSEGAFKRGDGYTLSYLSTDNNCRMVFLLPEEGRTVGEFLESPEKLREAMEAKDEDWVSGKVIWKVPKFDFGCSYPLNEILKAMGMERMFGGQAEFGEISPDPLMVSSVIQETHIGVDENGVEGAAYTMMAMARGALIENTEQAEMILDRPFLFGIREDNQDVWLFLGVCRNPDKAEETGRKSVEDVLSRYPRRDTSQAEPDLLLTSAPEVWLQDALSSTRESFSLRPGNYSWKWLDNGKTIGEEACGSHPLDVSREQAEILEIPQYNGTEEVSYMFGCVAMPQTVTVREWDISQLGRADGAEPSEKIYMDPSMIFLRKDRVYELVARWPEEELKERGFSGEASYVVVTD